MDAPSTVAAALGWAASQLRDLSTTARLDAELLLSHMLGWSRARVLAEGRQPLTAQQFDAYAALIARRSKLEPVAYLLGRREFYGLDLIVTPAVLVPRPETELLVDSALTWARQRVPSDAAPPLVIADVGTGSGAIVVALATHLPQARLYAIDRSPEALGVAAANIERHQLGGRVQLVVGDLLAPLPEPADLIVSNPPYTVLAEIDEGVRRHEPHLALDGGADGLDVYRRLVPQIAGALRPGGAAVLEIGATQTAAVAALARQSFPAAQIQVQRDLAGHDRVVMIDTRIHG